VHIHAATGALSNREVPGFNDDRVRPMSWWIDYANPAWYETRAHDSSVWSIHAILEILLAIHPRGSIWGRSSCSRCNSKRNQSVRRWALDKRALSHILVENQEPAIFEVPAPQAPSTRLPGHRLRLTVKSQAVMHIKLSAEVEWRGEKACYDPVPGLPAERD
jgi:hypothetical protein